MKVKYKKKIAVAFLGTIIEYYDYSLYGFSAGILATKFFPPADQLTGLIYSFLVYALGYLAKPLGAIFFSKLGDTYGRKVALRFSLVAIAIPTLIIGLLPEFKYAGAFIMYVLMLCRFFQGIFVAGEYDGAAIYIMEHLGESKKYTASAITRCSGVGGLLLGIIVVNFFNSKIFTIDWAWRIPFILSFPLSLITVYYRKFLLETPDYLKSIKKSSKISNTFDFLSKHWKKVLIVAILSGGFGVTYQGSVVFMKQFLPIVLPKTKSIILFFTILNVLIFGTFMPIAGFLADKYGRKIVIQYSLVFTIIALLLLSVGILNESMALTLSASLLLSASVAPFNSLAHGAIMSLFLVTERYRGISFGHTLGSMIMSSSANYIFVSGMKKFKFQLFPLCYIAFFAIIAFIMMNYIVFNKKDTSSFEHEDQSK